jgi:hypothetical protein
VIDHEPQLDQASSGPLAGLPRSDAGAVLEFAARTEFPATPSPARPTTNDYSTRKPPQPNEPNVPTKSSSPIRSHPKPSASSRRLNDFIREADDLREPPDRRPGRTAQRHGALGMTRTGQR